MPGRFRIKTKVEADTKLRILMWCHIFYKKPIALSSGHFRQRLRPPQVCWRSLDSYRNNLILYILNFFMYFFLLFILNPNYIFKILTANFCTYKKLEIFKLNLNVHLLTPVGPLTKKKLTFEIWSIWLTISCLVTFCYIEKSNSGPNTANLSKFWDHISLVSFIQAYIFVLHI